MGLGLAFAESCNFFQPEGDNTQQSWQALIEQHEQLRAAAGTHIKYMKQPCKKSFSLAFEAYVQQEDQIMASLTDSTCLLHK